MHSPNKNKSLVEVRQEILEKVKDYYDLAFGKPVKFIPGESYLNYAGRKFDSEEMINLVSSSLDFWLTAGRYAKQFEAELASFLGLNYSLLVNSGSSANLVAFSTLTSPLLKDRQIKKGDEVITVAAGFPTTVAPMIQFGAVPVFVDVELETANIDVTQLKKALSTKTKAVMVAHTLGNPFNLEQVMSFCKENNLWLIEDNCDALGSLYNGKLTGTFGDIGTSSFYPAHHITMGEGGAVYMNHPLLKRIAASFRDWGRDCWCDAGKDNTCGRRFSQQHGTLPFGYDHKYVYSHFGYNLKATDMQAAIGVAQLKKINEFGNARRRNWQYLNQGLQDLSHLFVLPQPTPKADPSWFGFLLTIKQNAGFSRAELVGYLEADKIQTRNLFAGNMIRHPSFQSQLTLGKDYRVVGKLTHTDKIMNDSFWLGVYPGMTKPKLNFILKKIHAFAKAIKSK